MSLTCPSQRCSTVLLGKLFYLPPWGWSSKGAWEGWQVEHSSQGGLADGFFPKSDRWLLSDKS